MASVPINASDHELTTTRFLASLVTSQRKIEVFSSQLCGSSIWMQISAAWRATCVLTDNKCRAKLLRYGVLPMCPGRTNGKMVAGERYNALPTIDEALFSYRRRAA
jgi:hypothetical protein